MNDDAAAPPDPFHATTIGCVALLEIFRNFRHAGGGYVESAVLTAAQIAVSGTVAQHDEGHDCT